MMNDGDLLNLLILLKIAARYNNNVFFYVDNLIEKRLTFFVRLIL